MEKIKSLKEISNISEVLRKKNKTIITTNGSFDILHYAHIDLLNKAKNEGDILIVLLNSDLSVKRFKGENRPIIPEQERAFILASLSCVDYVVIFEEDKPLNIIEKIKPNKHVKGGSFIPERVQEERALLATWGGELKGFGLEEGFSTTFIIQKVLDNYKNEESQ